MLTHEEVASIRKLNDARRAKKPAPLPANAPHCLKFALRTAVDMLIGQGTIPNTAILFGEHGQCFSFGPPMKLNDEQKMRFLNDIFCASIAARPVCVGAIGEVWLASVDPALLSTNGSQLAQEMPGGAKGASDNLPRPSTMPDRQEAISIILEWQNTQASWHYRILRNTDGEVVGIDDQGIYSMGNAQPRWAEGKFAYLQVPEGIPDELRARVAAEILPVIGLDFDLHAPMEGGVSLTDVELDMED